MLVARAIMSPSFLLNVGVSKDAISLPYIQSSADLPELRTGVCETRCFLIRSDPLTPIRFYVLRAMEDAKRSGASLFLRGDAAFVGFTCGPQQPCAYLRSRISSGEGLDQPIRDSRHCSGILILLPGHHN